MNTQSSTSKSSARAAIALLLALSFLPAFRIDAAAQAKSVAAKSEAATGLTDDNREDIETLVSGYGTMAKSEFRAWLDGAQPAEPTEAEYKQSLDLITKGAKEAKLAIVENGDRTYRLSERAAPVLKFFRRTQVRFVVVVSATPTLESSPGLIIIISTGMIAALRDDANSLNALVAHELAHELTWRQYVRARNARQFSVTQFLELQCDAVAAYTLLLLGMKPAAFAPAIAAAVNTDAEVARLNQGVGTHPSLAARLALNKQLADALKRVPNEPNYNAGGQLATRR